MAGKSLKTVELELRTVLSEFQRIDLAEMPDESFVETRDALESRILKVPRRINERCCAPYWSSFRQLT